jgi:hypothetical protein
MEFHGDIDFQQGRLLSPAVASELGLPDAGIIAGRLAFVGGILYICTEVVEGVPSWIPLTNKVTSYLHTQEEPSTIWEIYHDLAQEEVIVAVYDTDKKQVIPHQIQFVDANTAQIVFSEAQTGEAICISGSSSGMGFVRIPSFTHVQDVAKDVWTIRHFLGVNPFVQVFEGTKMMLPNYIKHVSESELEIGFDKATSGFARCI